MAFAHSANTEGKRHDLVAHLRSVGLLTAQFSEALGARDAGYLLGLWHDVGKFDPDWQRYLLACEADPTGYHGRVDHKAAGSKLADIHGLGHLRLLIQGHHGGLRRPADFRNWLATKETSDGMHRALETARRTVPDLEPLGEIPLPPHVSSDPHAAELFLRLLFSALIDADRLDTERHFSSSKAEARGSNITISELWRRFEANQSTFIDSQSSAGNTAQYVNSARREIYEACLLAAESAPGLFRLTVPTGGGKTRSGLAFALRHAVKHGQARVIVAVPFLSITQQTAKLYRDIFRDPEGDQPIVLEHHTGVEQVEDDDGEYSPAGLWARLSAENWDAPVIVTTTVQLFESLFANGTAKTRKLHRLANSVLVLDEAQALPCEFLDPILGALEDLSRHYNTTVVLSTATQPAFDSIPAFAQAHATEIVPEPWRYFKLLQRVSYEWHTESPVSWDEVAAFARENSQALVVVNTKKDAMELIDALGDRDVFHLSTLLCGLHRLRVIDEIKRRLEYAEPCCLVSTQVVEAGVDLDFPLVLRALGPFDGIIQAAGRANRGGKLTKGRVVVFRPETGRAPLGSYRVAIDVTTAMLKEGRLDPDSPDSASEYFRRLFGVVDTDPKGIQALRSALDYPRVDGAFRMIDDTESVIVTNYPVGDESGPGRTWITEEEQKRVMAWVGQLRGGGIQTRALLRRLQPFMVAVRKYEAETYRRDHFISSQPIVPGVYEWLGGYHWVRGLEARNPDALVI